MTTDKEIMDMHGVDVNAEVRDLIKHVMKSKNDDIRRSVYGIIDSAIIKYNTQYSNSGTSLLKFIGLNVEEYHSYRNGTL